jgi:hypothetical protein
LENYQRVPVALSRVAVRFTGGDDSGGPSLAPPPRACDGHTRFDRAGLEPAVAALTITSNAAMTRPAATASGGVGAGRVGTGARAR